MMEYDTFPLKKFWKILENEELLQEFGISLKDWEALKDEWNERHPSKGTEKLIEASRKVILEDLRLKSYVLLAMLISDKQGDYSEHYKTLGIKYQDTNEERVLYLEKNINKTSQKLKIFIAQKKQLELSMKKNETEEDNKTELNEVLASFEIAGISVGNYEEMTLGRYDGLNKAFERKAEIDKRNGR